MQKAAFITGTSKGIGKAITELLLTNNYLVFGFSRNNNIKHQNFTFIKIDLSNLEQVQKLQLPKVKAEKIILINNAATIGEINPLHLKAENAMINEYNLNIITPTLLCKDFIQTYPTEKKLILNISSGAANKAIASWSTYCATKSALDSLTAVIDEEKHQNLKILSISPGVVDTNMQKEIRNSDPKNFPLHQNFVDYYAKNELISPKLVAIKLLKIIEKRDDVEEILLNLRDFA
mgnify:FL=1